MKLLARYVTSKVHTYLVNALIACDYYIGLAFVDVMFQFIVI